MTQEEFDRRITAILRGHEEVFLEIMALKESQKKTDEQIKKTDEQIKKTSLEIMALKESQKKTDEQIKKTDEQIKKTDEQIKKTDEQIKKTDLELREMVKHTRELLSGISNGWGRLTEGFAIASVRKIFSNIGIPINYVFSRAQSVKNGKCLELDLLSIGKKNGKDVAIVIEVKTYLTIKDIKDFLKDLERFYEFFEEYRNLDLIGGIAFMNPSKNAKEYAEKNGLYLLSLGEDTMCLANSPNFKPRVYRYKL